MEYPPETGGGGIGSYVASIAPALASLGHEVHVLSCLDAQKPSYTQREGVHIHRRGLVPIRGLGRLASTLKLKDTIRRLHTGLSAFLEYRKLGIDFDVIEHPDWNAEGWLFAFLKVRPTVAHLHTPLPLIIKYNRLPMKLDGHIASIIEHFAVKHSEVITSPSKYLANELKRLGWLRDSDIHVISYPVDLSSWKHTRPVSETSPTVLFVGRLETLKAPEILAQAITIIRKEIPQAKAVFVGRSNGKRDGLNYVEWVKKIAGDTHSCQFVGHVPRSELPRFFSECRVLAIPSWHDNYPMVALESMAAGRAVVVTQNTGVMELLETTQAGKIVPSGDPNALADALRPFLADAGYAEKMGEKARNTAFGMLDPIKLAEERIKAYRKAIEVFHARLRTQASGFRRALPERVASFQIPRAWRNWAVSEVMKRPWKHFYFPTSRQLLELMAQIPRLKGLDNFENIRVLDVGCTPAVSLLLACLGAQVYLLDTDPSELNKGKKIAQLLNRNSKVKYILADALRIPCASNRFDIVWNSGFIEHFDKPHLIIREMGRVVCKDGALIVLVPNRWTPHTMWIRESLRRSPRGYYWDIMGRERSYTRNDLVKLVRASGFHVMETSTANLRRTIIDDSIVLPRLSRMFMRGFLFKLMNFVDRLELHLPLVKRFGFMTGVLAISSSVSELEKQIHN